MPHQYSSALSHLVLAGVTLYCLKNYGLDSENFNFCHATYLLVLSYSCIGIWRWGNPGHGIGAVKLYHFLAFLQSLYTLPTFSTEMWLKHSNYNNLAYLFCLIPLLPLVLRSWKRNLCDVLILTNNIVNCLSLVLLCFAFNNLWGVTAAVSYFLAFFIIKERLQDIEIPTQDLFNYGLSFFMYFTLCALQ